MGEPLTAWHSSFGCCTESVAVRMAPKIEQVAAAAAAVVAVAALS